MDTKKGRESRDEGRLQPRCRAKGAKTRMDQGAGGERSAEVISGGTPETTRETRVLHQFAALCRGAATPDQSRQIPSSNG